MTAFVVVFVSAFILLAGLVIDGGLALSARVRALDEAQAAARAGAESIDLATYRATGTVVLDPASATAAVNSYLAATGDQGEVTVNGDIVTVTVTTSEPTQILDLVGIDSIHESATASATTVKGITEAGQ